MSELEYKPDQISPDSPEDEEQELGFADKIVGIFTEPSATYEKVAKFPPKLVDWLVPYLLLLLIVALSNTFLMRNPEIRYQVKQKQVETMNKRLADDVNSKKITPEQANQQKEMMEKQADMMDLNSPFIIAVTFVSIIVGGLIVILIVAGYFYLFSKFVFKEGTSYTETLVANGLTCYIGIISVIFVTILSLVFGRMLKDVSVASLMNIEGGTILHYLLAKIDVFTIWSYAVFSIGLAKMYKSPNVNKYFALVFGSWIIWSLLFFALSKTSPIFSAFGG